MARLQEMGEFVRSASSTIEAPVVRRLKEEFSAQAPKAQARKPRAAGPSEGVPVAPVPSGAGPAGAVPAGTVAGGAATRGAERGPPAPPARPRPAPGAP